jgi:hypothetical protein
VRTSAFDFGPNSTQFPYNFQKLAKYLQLYNE